MKGRSIFAIAGVGLLLALASAFLFALTPKPMPPAFKPAANPYAQAIYAEGIIESPQASGANVNMNPEVSGTVARVFVREGQRVRAGDPLIALDDSIQRATADQEQHQAEAAKTLLTELVAEPRAETLEVTRAQLSQARATLALNQRQWDKQRRSYELDPRSVSKEALDTAEDNAKIAAAALEVAQRQFDLTKAGAWAYDVQNQRKQAEALAAAADSGKALLGKFVLRAPTDGVVLAINAASGGYISSQGVYDTYTQGQDPVVVVGADPGQMHVRVYVDEILVQQLPAGARIRASMTVRGSTTSIPLQFVRVQPYLSPKIELSDQRQERVDLRVLPVIFTFQRPPGVTIYPGQLVDVFIGQR